MAWLVGVLLAAAVGFFARVVGLDRDRAFYPTVTIVIGMLYALFAVMGGSTQALLIESLVGAVFVAAAVVGFRSGRSCLLAGILWRLRFDGRGGPGLAAQERTASCHGVKRRRASARSAC